MTKSKGIRNKKQSGYDITFFCKTCGKEVNNHVVPSDYKSGNTHEYCSAKCASAHRKTRIPTEYICETCHQKFIKISYRKHRFCSSRCRALAKGKHLVKHICEWCGKEFERHACRQGRFCSVQCNSEFGARQPRPNARRPETMHIERICLECGNKYYTTKVQIEKRGSNYCSRKCMGDAQSRNMMGEKHPRWKGCPPNTRGQNWDKITRFVRKRDNNTCQICGRKRRKNARNFDVHHIIPYRLFAYDYEKSNAYSNLILLCRNCHALTENNKIPCPYPRLF